MPTERTVCEDHKDLQVQRRMRKCSPDSSAQVKRERGAKPVLRAPRVPREKMEKITITSECGDTVFGLNLHNKQTRKRDLGPEGSSRSARDWPPILVLLCQEEGLPFILVGVQFLLG